MGWDNGKENGHLVGTKEFGGHLDGETGRIQPSEPALSQPNPKVVEGVCGVGLCRWYLMVL